MPLEGVSVLCFAASYAVALALELSRLIYPGKAQRIGAVIFGGAGLFAHSIFLALRLPSLSTEYGAILFLSWIMAVFYFVGSFRHAHKSFSIFLLPIVLGLVTLVAALSRNAQGININDSYLAVDGREFWRILHVALFVLAGTGISVGFAASVMYLVQARRLRSKSLPGWGLRMLSLERLETMNRRAIGLAFPFLTAGLLVGTARMLDGDTRLAGWTDVRILSTIAVWLIFALLLPLRYGFHLRGRPAALFTIAAFFLLLLTLVSAHAPAAGGPP
jgi:ABC-type transport system involved in cytochrome c biogenesis permease subunit